MGTQTTGGGSTTSFVNTPQAVDDSYNYSEDALWNSTLYNRTTRAVTLDVMSNDLGGNAKSLFSIDDGNGNVLAPDFELLTKDVNAAGCSPWEKTPDGNWIRINNGKIEFKLGNPAAPDDPAQALDLNSLGTDRSVDDEFVYAIRLANGTLSQATVRIHITGQNDAVQMGAVTGASINDTAGNDHFAAIIGKLTSADQDYGDTPSYGISGSAVSDDTAYDVMKSTAYGTLYLDTETGDYKFVPNDAAINGLDSDDAPVALNFTVSVTDGDTTDTDTLTITLNGANDTPTLAAVTGATIDDGSGNDTFSDITGTLVGSDRDAGETLTYGVTGSSASDDPAFDWMVVTAYGTLYLDKDSGAYKFVADNAAINGLDSDDAAVVLNFGVSVSDGDASDSKTLSITINGANDTPVLTGTAAALPDGTEDNSYNVTKAQLLQGWTDADTGEILSITGLTASNGTVVANADGSFTITPAANFNGSVTLNYSVSDGTVSVPTSLSYTLLSVNDAPAGTDNTVVTLEDTAKTLAVADFGFSDTNDTPANALLSVKITTLPASGTLTLNGVAVAAGDFVLATDIAAGKLVYTPAPNAVADATFTFQVRDDGGTANGGVDLDQSANTLTIDITPVNDAPAGTDNTVVTLEDTAKTLAVADFGFTDPNDSPANVLLSVKIATLPASGTLTLNGVAVVAGDFVLATDIAAGKLVYTPAPNAVADATFTFQVRDDGGTTNGGVDLDQSANTLTIDITPVNDAPAGTDNTVVTLEDTAKTLAVADFGFTDPNDTPANALLSVKITTLPASGTLTLNGVAVAAGDFVLATDIAAGKLVYTPAPNATADATFTFQVRDDGGTANGGIDLDQSANTLTIDITPVNDAPAGTDNTVVTLEDTAKTLAVADFGFTDPNDSPANALLSVKITTLPASGTLTLNGVAVAAGDFVLATDIAAGKLVYTPAPNAVADATFTFQVRDDGGTANGGVDLDQSANTLTIDITPVNDAPAGTDNTVVTLEDTAKTLAVADFGFTDPNDAPANSLLSVKITTLPASGTLTLNGLAVVAGDFVLATDIAAGKLVYTPAANATADATFTFQVRDDGGTANGGVDLDQSANTLTIDITPVNDAPAGADNTVVTLEDTAKTLAVADFGFTDPNDSPANALLSVKITTLPASGTLTLNGVAVAAGDFVLATDIAAGKLVYTPATNAVADATFTFQVRDDGGTANGGVDLDQSANTLTIDITPVNDAPAGTDNTVVTLEDTAKTLAVADFGFTDPNDTPANALLSVKIATLPASGTLTLNGVAVAAGDFVLATDIAAGKLVYTPAPNATADATFTFQVRDDGGTANGGVDLDSTANTLTIDITPVNDAPVAGTVSLGSYHEDGLRTITPAELLAGASDVEGDALSITNLVIASGGGTLYPNSDGTWYYRPDENSSGPVSFTYTVSDGVASTDGTANLTILPANDAPFLDMNPDPTTNAATLDYTTGDGTVVIAPGATVTDVDSPDFGGGYLTVSFAQGGTSADTLAIRNQGIGSGQIGISGGNVTYGGVVIGTFSGGTAGSQLSIDFNANATQTAISALLENITFATTGTSTTSKEVHFWVNDGDGTANFGWDTFGAVAFINVEQGDVLAPTDIKFALAPTVGSLTGNGLGAGATLGSFTVVDSDSTSWTYALTPTGTVPPAVGISIVGGVVNLVTTGAVSTGKYTFTMTVTDGGGNARVEAYTLSVGDSGGNPATSFTITNADPTDPNTGTDISFGLNGGDIINGGGGDDAMVGGNGTDTLNGGLGNDQLFGGQQDDIFIFNTAISPTPNVDKILDFNGMSSDKIHLDDAIFLGLTNANLAVNFQSSATGAFTGTAKLLYNSTTGDLYYDSDGAAGGAAAVLFANITLVGGTLDSTDFVII